MNKCILLIVLLFLITTIYAENVIECLRISGDFTKPIQIWKDRWYSYNKTIKEIDTNEVAKLYGYYKLQDFTINRQKCWKQINGDNIIWFGFKLSPTYSYDAWFIGHKIFENPPSAALSIPCLPTFIPNNAVNIIDILDPTKRPLEVGCPIIERVFLTSESLDSLFIKDNIDIEVGNIVANTDGKIINLDIHNDFVTIFWQSFGGNLYNVYGAFDVKNFILIDSNILATPPINYYTDTIKSNIYFYKIQNIRNQ